jgi:hypothetical protein
MESQLEEIPYAPFEEEGPGLDGMLFEQQGAASLLHREVTNFLNRKFLENGLAGASLSLGHLDRLTLLLITFSFGES